MSIVESLLSSLDENAIGYEDRWQGRACLSAWLERVKQPGHGFVHPSPADPPPPDTQTEVKQRHRSVVWFWLLAACVFFSLSLSLSPSLSVA